MPKIDVRKTVELTLPSYPESKVILYNEILAGGMENVMTGKTDFEKGLFALKELIKDWNFDNEKGEKLAISLESLRLLPLKDLTFLMKKVEVFFTQVDGESKKFLKK